ncbi:MAG: hypothetical protein V2J51_16210 [Erythrobacter sp.]|jgi:hypothetical protein|nr:hypothetical protein [Erythrobacter sp.]
MAKDYLTLGEIETTLARLAALKEELVRQNRTTLIDDPKYAETLNTQLGELAQVLDTAERDRPDTADGGLAALIGLGEAGVTDISQVPYTPPVPSYDDQIARRRLAAIADLYFIYQHERMGVFRAVLKLQELFRAGSVRLSEGPGATMLYQYDRKQVLRYTRRERMQAYRKVFGYTDSRPPQGAPANSDFHMLFTNFARGVSQFFQDKRVSEVIRPDGSRDSFGSMAVVRRSGLDLRHSLKQASYGHILVLKTEVNQLLESAFQILAAPDVRNLFGAPGAWDTLEEVIKRYLNETPVTSQRSRMAVAGKSMLRWLSEPYILSNVRVDFETYLEEIVDPADDWLTSAESLGLQRERVGGAMESGNVVPLRARSRRTG